MNATVTRASMEFALTFKTDLAVCAMLAGLGLYVTRVSSKFVSYMTWQSSLS